MKNNIKIFAIVALFALLGLLWPNNASAQTKFTYDMGSQCAGLATLPLIEKGHSKNPAHSTYNYGQSGSKIVDYINTSIYVLNADGSYTDITTSCIVAGGENGIGLKEMLSGSSTKLYNFSFGLWCVPGEHYGKTISVQLSFGKAGTPTMIEEFTFDIVGAPVTIDDSGILFDDSYTDNAFYVCPGDPIVLKLANSEYPFGVSPSYNGNKYYATYSWGVTGYNYITEGLIEDKGTVATDTKEFVDHALTSGSQSARWDITPTAEFHLNDASGSLVCVSRMSPAYAAYYESPITSHITLNGKEKSSSDPSIAICDGDELTVAFDFTKDGVDYSEVWVGIYPIIGGSESPTPVYENDFLQNFEDFSCVLSDYTDLVAKGGHNTTYDFVLKVKDVTNEFAPNHPDACNGESIEFSVLVREKAATIQSWDKGDGYCEEGTIKIQAIVKGENVSTYTYSWELDEKSVDTEGVEGTNNKPWATKNNVSYGNVPVKLIINNSGCKVEKETTVYVQPNPVGKPTDDQVCLGDEATLSVEVSNHEDQQAGAKYKYYWDAPAVGDGSITKESKAKVTPSTKGTHPYNVKIENTETGCKSKVVEVKAIVTPIPEIESISGPVSLCIGSTVEYTANLSSEYDPKAEPITYNWTRTPVVAGKGTAATETNTTGKWSFTLDASYTVSVIAVDNNNCTPSDPKTKTTTATELPTFSIADVKGCSKGSTEVTITNTSSRTLTYTFVGKTPGAPAISGTTDESFTVSLPEVSTATDYTYEVTGEDASGCQSTEEFKITVNPLPKVSAVSDDYEICLGDEITLTATASNVDFEWVGNGLTGDKTKASTKATPTASGNQVYYVKVKDKTTSCENKSANVTVTVNALPKVTLAADKTTICEGLEVNLTATATSGVGNSSATYTYTWADPIGKTNASNTEKYKMTEKKTFSVSVVESGTNCSSAASNDVTVDISKAPTISHNIDTYACEGTTDARTLTINVTNSVPSTFTVTGASNISAASSTPSTSATFTLTPSTGTKWSTDVTYTITATSGDGCEILASEDDVLTVNPQPKISSAKSDKTSQCLGQNVKLSAEASTTTSGDKTLTYTWYEGSSEIGTGKSIDHTESSAGTHTYHVVVTDKKDCSTTSEDIVVEFYKMGEVTISASKTSICNGETVTLTANLSSGSISDYNILWSDGSTTESIDVKPTASTNYTVTLSHKATKCETTDDIDITVNQLPKFTMALDKDQVCDGKVTELTLTMTPTAESETVGAVDHYEFVSGGSSTDFVKQSDNVYKANKAWTSNTTYVYKAVTAVGCESVTQSVTINVNPIPAAPVVSVSPAQICKGAKDPVTFTVTNAESGVDYFWYSDAACTVPLNSEKAANIFKPAVASTSALSGNTVYYVKAVNNTTECDNETIGSATLIVNAIPAAELSVDNPEFCVGTATATITATMSDAATYTYEWKSVPAGYTATSKDILVSPDVTTTYTLVATNTSTTCKTEAASKTITVHQKPVFTVSFDREVCSGEEATVTMTMSTTDNISDYTITSGTPAFSKVSTGEYTATATWTSDTEYTISATSDKTCESLPVKATLKVNAHPAAPEFTMTPAIICVSDATPSVELKVVSPVATSTYEWFQGSTSLGYGTSHTITSNPGVDTEYSVREISSVTCTGDLATKTLKVNALPTVTITGDINPCAGESITLTAVPVASAGGTFAADAYTWYADDVVIDGETSSTLTVTPTKDTKYSVSVKESNAPAVCESAKFDVNVTIRRRPDFTISLSPAFVCENLETTVTMTMTEADGSPAIASYTLASGPSDFTEVSLGKYTATKTWSTNTVYEFTAVAANGCDLTVPVPVTLEVNAQPETPELSFQGVTNNTLCRGIAGPITAEITNFKKGMKYTVTDGTNDIVKDHESNTFEIPVPSVATTYHITGVAGDNCYTEEGTATLSIAELPTVSISGSSSICEGTYTTLTANATAGAAGTLSYVWTAAGEDGDLGYDKDLMHSPTETTTYTVTVTEAGLVSCQAVDTYKVTVEKKPVIKVTSENTDFCAGVDQTVTLSASAVDSPAPVESYEWYDAMDVSQGTGSTLPISKTWAKGNYKFYAIATSSESNHCKSDKTEITINVNPIPTKPAATLSATEICFGNGFETVVATITDETLRDGYVYTWYDKEGVELGTGASFELNVKNDVAGDVNFSVIATDANFTTNCQSLPYAFSVSVQTLPLAPVILGSAEYCLNDASHETVISVDAPLAALSYEWYKVDGVNGDVKVADGATFTSPAHLDETTTYYAVGVSALGCVSPASVAQTVTIINNPVLTSVDGAKVQVCPADPSQRDVTVTSANGENLIFEWSLDGTPVDVASVESTATSSTFHFSTPAQTGTFHAVVNAWIDNSGVKGCQADALEFDLVVKDFEELQFKINNIDYVEGKQFDLCQGTDANIVFSNLDGVSYRIKDKEGVVVVDSSADECKFPITSDNEYTLVKYTGDCVSPAEQHFSIVAKKQVLFELSAPLSACLGTELSLGIVDVDLQGATSVDYQWYFNGVAISGATSETYFVASVANESAGTYSVTATNEFGCETTRSVSLDVHSIPTIVWDEEISTNILCLDGEERYLAIKPAEGNEAAITNSLWDINTLHFGSVNTEDKITVKAVSPDQVDGESLVVRVYAVDENGCQSLGIERTLTAVATPVITSVSDAEGNVDAFHLCAGNALTLTVNSTPATGNFVYHFTKDGADIDWATPTLTFDAITADMAGTYTVQIEDLTSGCSSTEFTFTIEFPVPEATLSIVPESKLVIANTEVVATVTPGFFKYEFFLGSELQYEGTENVFKFNPAESATVVVNVYNEYGCFITLQEDIEVLPGVLPSEVVITPATYCSSERASGATISVATPQYGVTYILTRNEDNVEIGRLKVETDGQTIEWTGLQTVEATSVTLAEASNTYSVIGFHESLPDESVAMKNVVVLTEVFNEIVESATPTGTAQKCGDKFTLTNAIEGYLYQVYLDNAPIYDAPVVADASGVIVFPAEIDRIGVYEIRRTNPVNEFCGDQIVNVYTIEGYPTSKVTISADGNPQYAYYCKNEKSGVTLTTETSDAEILYNLYFKATPASASEIVKQIQGSGAALVLGNTADDDMKGDGQYFLGIDLDGCIQPLSTNFVNVAGYSAPDADKFTVNAPAYFCEGSTVAVSVTAEHENYYEYRLFREEPTYNDYTSYNVISGATAATDNFNVTEGGIYHILVVNTNLEKMGLDCANTQLPSFEIRTLITPQPIEAKFNKNDFCLESDGTASAVLTINALATDPFYTIYENDAVVSDKLSNELKNLRSPANGSLAIEIDLTEGEHTFTVKAYQSVDGVVCDEVVVATATVNVRPRPGKAGEVVAVVDNAERKAIDSCYGKDITVTNTREGYVYTLYAVGAASPFIDGGFAAEGVEPKSSALGNGAEIRFNNIAVDGDFYVTVNYADAVTSCADEFDPVTIAEGFIKMVVPEFTNPTMCQGSGATQVRLQSHQVDVVYKVYDVNGNLIMTSKTDAVEDGDALIFNRQFTSSTMLTVIAARLKVIDGEEVETCPVTLGQIQFTVNPLPKSFELTGRNIFCGDLSDIQLTLPESEADVEYVLYVFDENLQQMIEYTDKDGNLVKVMGRDDNGELMFPRTSSTDPRFLDPDLYTVIARNIITGCTSAMKNEVKVVKRGDINKDYVTLSGSFKSCNGKSEKIEIGVTKLEDNTDPFEGVTFYIYRSDNAEELANFEKGVTTDMLASIVEDQDKADDLIIRKYMGKKLPVALSVAGDYIVMASYDEFACPAFIDKFTYEVHNINTYQLTAAAICGGKIEYTLIGSQEGVDYKVFLSADGIETELFSAAGTGDPIVVELENNVTDPNAKAYAVAYQGSCDLLMDGEIAPATLSTPIITPLTITDTGLICQSGDDKSIVYAYDSYAYQPGITYHFMLEDSESSPVEKAAMVTRKADENGNIKADFPAGVYTVWASFDEYRPFDCLQKMDGVLDIKSVETIQFSLTSEMTCTEGVANILLNGSQPGYFYTISDKDGNVVETQTGLGNALSWTVLGTDTVSYSLTVTNGDGACPVHYDPIDVDFTKFSTPTGSLDLLIVGNKWSSADTATFCHELPVTFIPTIQGMSSVTTYEYKFEQFNAVDSTYSEVDADTVSTNILSKKFDLAKFAPNNLYKVTLSISNNECGPYELDPYLFRLTAVDTLDVTDTLNICDAETTVYKSNIYKSGYTYYFMANDDISSPREVAPLFTKQVDAEGYITLDLAEGSYSVWASNDTYRNYDCLTQMYGAIKVNRTVIDKFLLTAEMSCNHGDGSLVLDGSQSGYKYIFSTVDLADTTVVVDTIIGTGDKLKYFISGSDKMEYKLTVVTNDTTCYYEYPTQVVDFNSFVEPFGSFDMFIEGKKWEKNDTIVPQICSSSSVSLIADVKGMADISTFSYEFFKLVEVVDTVTSTTKIVTDTAEYAHSTSSVNIAPQYFGNFDQSQMYRVFLKVSNNECGPYMIDSLDFNIKGSAALANRFMPDPMHAHNVDTVSCLVPNHSLELHGEYCADESGVGLFFKNAEPGNIYRLFQRTTEVVDSATTIERVEMLDMQEIPDYSSFIPGYVSQPVDTLWFTGWGANAGDNAYGATGDVNGTSYFVSIEETDGCIINTADLVIYENPLPIDTVSTSPTYNQVYYALLKQVEVGGEIVEVPNRDVMSTDYGIVDAGFVILENPISGMFYDLRHVDSPLGPDYLVSHIFCDDATQEKGWVSFGKVGSGEEDIAQGWGSGIYEVIATNPLTGCSASIGSIEFIDEELVAYNVYLYLNKKHNSTSQLLYPSYEKFGNHRYIDWSRKVDVVWSPALVTDTITGVQYIDPQAEDYEKRSGYSIYEKNANIHFEMVQAMKDTVTFHDVDINEYQYADLVESDPKNTFKQIQTRLEKYFLYQIEELTDTLTGETTILKDSVSTGDILITYKNGKEDTRTYINTADENTKPTNDLGEVIETYKYWHTVYDTIQVPDYSKKYGDYGFDADYDAIETPELAMDSKSGLFRYTKMPSFFGKVELTYRIYNDLLPTVRFSNNAQIVILCGNNTIPGSDVSFLVPNAFSPNGDGLNDDFKILLPHGYENSQVILEVFNRWGTRVYKSSGIRYGIDCPYWDGTSTTSNMVTVGEKLPSGTYYYVLTIRVNNPSTGETQDLDLKGFIELRR